MTTVEHVTGQKNLSKEEKPVTVWPLPNSASHEFILKLQGHTFVKGPFLSAGTLLLTMHKSFSIQGKEISASSVMEDYQVRYSAPWVLSVNIVPRPAAGLQPAPKRGGAEDKGKGKGKEKGKGKGEDTKGYLGSSSNTSSGPATAPTTTQSSSKKEKDKKEKKETRATAEEEQAAKAAKKEKKGKKAAATTTEEKKVRKKKKKKPPEPLAPTYAATGFSAESSRPAVGFYETQS